MMSKTTALFVKHIEKPGAVLPCFCQESCKNGPSNNHRGGETPRKICSQSIATKLSATVWDWLRDIDHGTPVTPGENVGDPYSGGKRRPPAPNSGGVEKIWKSVVYDGFIFKSLNISIYIYIYIIYIYIYIHIFTLFAFGSTPVFDFRSFWRRAGENMLRTTVADGSHSGDSDDGVGAVFAAFVVI